MPETHNAPAVFEMAGPRLPYHPVIEERFGVSKSAWKALTEAVYPAAKTVDSVVMVLSYCKARRLDPFKRPVHIVPVWSSAANGGRGAMVETVWPGISEQRTTAMRTGLYAGCDEVEFGPDITETWTWNDDKKGEQTVSVTFPEWARMTLYRNVGGSRVAVVGPKVYWMETYATQSRWSPAPNEMWRKRPRGQIEKCAEAAALRRAFPEELGDEPTAEEMEGAVIHGPAGSSAGPRPSLSAGFETIEHERLEAPRTATVDQPSDDAGQLEKARVASAASLGDHDPKTGEVIEQANPLEWNGVVYPNKTVMAEAKRLANQRAAKPAHGAADPKPTSDSAMDASGGSAEGTSSQERPDDQSSGGEADPSTMVQTSSEPDGDTFPGDRPPAAEPETMNPMAAIMVRLGAAPSWDEILASLKAISATPEWKGAAAESKRVVRLAAWERFAALRDSGEERIDVTQALAVFRLWLEFGATSVEEIDLTWPAFWRSEAFRNAGEADKKGIMTLAGERKAALAPKAG